MKEMKLNDIGQEIYKNLIVNFKILFLLSILFKFIFFLNLYIFLFI